MEYENILTERRGNTDGILWITLNRPQRLNALSMDLFADLEHVFREVRKDRSVRCVVLTGAGRGFCAGADFSGDGTSLAESEYDLEGARLNFHRESDAYVALKNVEVPTIASVNGVCVGAGLDMVSHCDMAVGSTAARYQVAYVKRGIFADLGGFQQLPRIIGWRKAMEMTMTGRFMSAEEAHESGLTNYLVEPDELEAKTMELATMVENGPPIGQKIGKILSYGTQGLDFQTTMEVSAMGLAVTGASKDSREGGLSFREKREAKFTGR